MIKIEMIGHLGKDAVVNHVGGNKVINFTLAHTEKYKDAGGIQHEKTTWVDCSYWSDKTAIAAYLQRGKLIYIEGQPEARSFARNDGSCGASLTVRIHRIQLLGGGNNQQRPQQNFTGPGNNNIPNASEITEPIDDLPF